MQVCVDTASFEVVRNCWQTLRSLMEEGLVDLLLCNEDEALAVAEVLLHTSQPCHMHRLGCCSCHVMGK